MREQEIEKDGLGERKWEGESRREVLREGVGKSEREGGNKRLDHLNHLKGLS